MVTGAPAPPPGTQPWMRKTRDKPLGVSVVKKTDRPSRDAITPKQLSVVSTMPFGVVPVWPATTAVEVAERVGTDGERGREVVDVAEPAQYPVVVASLKTWMLLLGKRKKGRARGATSRG